MILKYLVACSLMLVSICGCAGRSVDVVWPSPRPLGKNIAVYRASRDPGKSERIVVKPNILEETEVLTLNRALALALLNNPELAAFSWKVRTREAQVLQAGLLPNPELETELENFAGKENRRDVETLETTITLRQLIPLWGKIAKRTKVAALGRDIAAWDYESKRLEILTRTNIAFVGVVSAQETLKSAQELFELSRQVLQTVSARVRAGKVSPVEEIKARISMSNNEIALEHAKRNLKSAAGRLSLMWGISTPSFKQAEDHFYVVSDIPSFDQLSDMIALNPEIARWKMELDKRRTNIQLEEAKAYPDVTVSAGVRTFNETNDHAFVAGISLPLPLFNRNQGGILKARYRLAQAKKEKRAAELMIYGRLNKTYQSLAASLSEVKTLQERILPDANLTFKSVTAGYREGKFNYLEVLDAQRTLFRVKKQYIEALNTYHTKAVELEALIASRLTSIKYEKTEKEGK